MKLRLSDRMLIILECLLFVALIVCIALPNFIGSDPLRDISDGIQRAAGGGILGDFIIAGIGVLFILLAVFVIMIAFRHPGKAEKVPYVMLDSGEKGSVRVSVAAIRQLVEEAVYRFEGVSQLAVRIEAGEDTIRIDVECVVSAGAHVPSVTMNIQRTVREYVEANCGIAVKRVDVTVNAVEQTAHEIIGELPHAQNASLPGAAESGDTIPDEQGAEAAGEEPVKETEQAQDADEGAAPAQDARHDGAQEEAPSHTDESGDDETRQGTGL